ncbi:hypothetical protein MUO32_26890 [Shinella sp. CPCC 101442]|uniref:hypothetical protein n=1 Tax=Shinella sp. CPCC 101442 TaxID=2932265 RepID=UPI0021520488|nr:hypothetical protein [Shinella sp. CPCC 101442]MCR6502659.1 hypothetical protein [Shinella sp. CPCC 101442]
MRKIMLSAVVAAVAALSFAAPSQAGGLSIGFGFGGGHHGWGHGHGHGWGNGAQVTFYDDDYGYDCFWKKVKRYDKWGNLKIKKIRVCE